MIITKDEAALLAHCMYIAKSVQPAYLKDQASREAFDDLDTRLLKSATDRRKGGRAETLDENLKRFTSRYKIRKR